MVFAYCHTRHERHDEEILPIFNLYRTESKAYHMDYCFCNGDWIRSFAIGLVEEWSQYSNCMPLFADPEMKCNNIQF